jgi:glycosyltransferase involved in cell wall biosynthesis
MNILVVADYLYPDVVGGSWNYAHEVARRLAARGHRCWSVSGHPGDDRPYREKRGAIEVVRYPVHRGSHLRSFASRVTGSLRATRQIMGTAQVDILHTHAPMGACGATLAPGARRVPQVATVHGTGVLAEYLCELAPLGRDGSGLLAPGSWPNERGARSRPHSRRARSQEPGAKSRLYCAAIDTVERWYLRRARRVHALSRFSGDAFVTQHRLDRGRVAIIPPGVDLERFQPGPRSEARASLGLPEGRPILLSVRRLTARMGLDVLLRSMRQVADAVPDVMLLIGGTGPMRPQLEALIAELGLGENVKLCGFIPDTELPLYYRAANLFVLPSLASEGFGLITLEALACNLPVLGTPVGATVELLGAFDPALLFPDTSEDAIAAHICEWLRRTEEPFQYRARVAEEYNWETIMTRFEAFLEGAANGA